MPLEKSCGAILFRKLDDKVKFLLLHYEAGHWDFPKGNQEQGESDEETAKREIEEETGIKDIELIDGFKEIITYFYKLKGELINKRVIYFLAETKTEKVKISFEHIGFSWMSYDNALKRLTYENSKELLKKASKFLHK